MMAQKSGVSVVLIARNEQGRIRRCLDSVKWAQEVVVIDQHSTDRTPEICREYGCKVIPRDMVAGFGEQKNFGIAQASQAWILSLDADEVVTPALCREIQTVTLSQDSHVAYTIPRLTWYLGRPIRHCGWYPSPVLRLFRRGAGSFNKALVHEEVMVDGPVGQLSENLLHYSYDSFRDHLRKLNLYTSLEAQMLATKGMRISWLNGVWYLLGKPSLVFLRKYLLQSGFRDGHQGLTLCSMAAFVVFINHIKLWELTRAHARG